MIMSAERIFVIVFALFAIMIFFVLAFKQGTRNRRDMEEIEKAELREISGGSEGEPAAEGGGVLGRAGSLNKIKSSVGIMLKVFGTAVLIAGTIISFCRAQTTDPNLYLSQSDFPFLLFFTYELTVCCAGFLFIGLGEIIRLLENINRRLNSR